MKVLIHFTLRNSLYITLVLIVFLLYGPAAAKKNVLFLMADDLNDWIGPYEGHPQANTPNLDKLAAKGVVFRNSQCSSPACLPSRTALHTGLQPNTTGVIDNGGAYFRDIPGLANHKTISQYFNERGYATAAGGKLFHGNSGDEMSDVGSWEEFNPTRSGASGSKNEGVASMTFGLSNDNLEEYGDYIMVNWVADFLDTDFDNRPFFLAAGVFRPHMHWYIPEPFYSRTMSPGRLP